MSVVPPWYVYGPNACLVPKRFQKGVSDLLDLELWVVSVHLVGAGKKIPVLCKCFKLMSYLSSPIIDFFNQSYFEELHVKNPTLIF